MLKCSFCNRQQSEFEQAISNPDDHSVKVLICNDCIMICLELLGLTARWDACRRFLGFTYDPADDVRNEMGESA